MRTLRYNLVDVFTDRALEGNQLAVFAASQGLSQEQMQSIAREMNLSETVFFFAPTEGGHARRAESLLKYISQLGRASPPLTHEG